MALADLPESTPLLEKHGALATITFNRPQHRNRLHREDLQALMAHFAALDADTSVRVVVLTGRVLAERPVFCAGYNIGQHGDEMQGSTFEEVADALERLRPLTICGLNGSVYGGATDFALACDFAIGVHGMEMRMPAAALGMHYYPGGIARYVSRLGVANAKRAFLTGQAFDADALLAMNYVSQLVPREQHAEAVQTLAQQLMKLAPLAQQELKRSINEFARGEYDAQRFRARQQATMASADFAEGCQAFAERRPPVFEGR